MMKGVQAHHYWCPSYLIATETRYSKAPNSLHRLPECFCSIESISPIYKNVMISKETSSH